MSTPDGDAARRLFEKLSRFVADELEDDERQALAALLAPGVARAHESDDEVVGFSASWLPDSLPEYLAEEIRGRSLRIEGL